MPIYEKGNQPYTKIIEISLRKLEDEQASFRTNKQRKNNMSIERNLILSATDSGEQLYLIFIW